MSTYEHHNGHVYVTGDHKPARLTEQQVETLLDVFSEAGAYEHFNQLYEVHRQAGGIERVTSMRAA